MLSNYFKRSNWDLDTAMGKICKNNFPFPILQLLADSDPAQPSNLGDATLVGAILHHAVYLVYSWYCPALHFLFRVLLRFPFSCNGLDAIFVEMLTIPVGTFLTIGRSRVKVSPFYD